MFTMRNARNLNRRRGMILMVVLALLTLFAIVGISFVLVANAQESAARIAREAETQFKPDIDPEAAFFFALGQILYDVKNNDTGVMSALRGHSLARSMYGWYDATENDDPKGAGNDKPVLNDKPYTGVGRLNYTLKGLGRAGTPDADPNDLTLANYMWFRDAKDSTNNPVFNKLRDPERMPLPDTSGNPRYRGSPGGKFDPEVQPYVPMAAVPYTYPDHNNFFLAAINPATGGIACPSFHRGYLFPLDKPNDPLWTDKDKPGILRTPRPITAYHPNFPRPIDGGGDVKNLDGVPGGCDSIWIDIGAPVMKSADGRLYKMLVAPLILDLDGRIDLNVVGNLMGYETQKLPDPNNPGQDKDTPVETHRSNQGWGPWEINPWKVLNNDLDAVKKPSGTEWRNLFTGSSTTGQSRYPGRYDTGGSTARKPFGPDLKGGKAGSFVRGWGLVDYNGCMDYGASTDTKGRPSKPMDLPKLTGGTNPPYFGFPYFGTSAQNQEYGYRNGYPLFTAAANSPSWLMPAFTDDAASTPNENDKHASLYWPYNPRAATATGESGRNYRFPVKDLVRLLRDGGTGADMIQTDLRGLIKDNLWSGGKRRNLVTLLSADLDRPGATPYIWDRYAGGSSGADDQATRYGLVQDAATGRWKLGTNSTGIPFPEPKTYRLKLPSPKDSEFDVAVDSNTMPPPNKILANTWRHNLQIKGLAEIRHRINLDRDLPDYPTPNGDGYLDMDPSPVASGGNPTATQQNYIDYKKAADARQKMADDIWKVLRAVTGAGDPGEVLTKYGATSAEFHALRALAQIAVNIVDYIDNDDVSTVFKLTYPVSGVDQVEPFFGFELPRLVLNEAYVQYDNEDGSVSNDKVDPDKNYVVNTWVELMNPMFDDRDVHKKGNLLDTTARLAKVESATMTTPIYRIVLCEAPTAATVSQDPMRKPENSNGDPLLNAQMTDPRSVMKDWNMTTSDKAVMPMDSTNRFDDPNIANLMIKENKGFLLVGPPTTFTDPKGATTDPGFTTKYKKMHASDDMRLKIKATKAGGGEADRPRPRIVLQRLANPALPLQDDPTKDGEPTQQFPNRLGYYNPWVTVDYIDNLSNFLQEGRLYDTSGQRQGANGPTPMGERVSVGRTQPYAASNVQLKLAAAAAMASEPTTTFYRQNSKTGTAAELLAAPPNHKHNVTGEAGEEPNLKLPFDWLVHLDRKIVNPFELWHVSGVAPWLVTQDFVQQPGLVGGQISDPDPMKKFFEPVPANQHTVPWGDEKARLYRFFEFVTTGVRGSFDSNNPQPLPLDRVMGKININTVWNRDVFRALADAQKSNTFYDSGTNSDKMVDDIFDKLMEARSKKTKSAAGVTNGDYTPDLRPTDKNLADALGPDWDDETKEPLDRPFWSFAMGAGASDTNNKIFAGRRQQGSTNTVDPTGLQDTLLRGNLFDVPDSDDHSSWTSPGTAPRLSPYHKKELLRKIFANLTTRSNVFGVWLTVGFFEVEDNATLPVKLGKEIGKAENRQVRYRMFAIVDRTRMKAFETTNTDDYGKFTNPASITPTFKAGDERDVWLWGNPEPPPNNSRMPYNGPYEVTDGRTNRTWSIKDDVYLIYEPGTDNEETVRVYMSGNPAKPKAIFQREHPRTCKVICRGNPGPIERYNARDDAEVVPFFMLID